MTPTYQSGFAAPGRGVPKYPELWKGCVGAWAPCLGVSGLRLHDNSMFRRHGTMIGTMSPSTGWEASQGRWANKFDGSNDYFDSIGSVSDFSFIQNTLDFTISWWQKISSLTTRMSPLGNEVASVNKGFFIISEFGLGFGTNALRIAVFNGTGDVSTSTIVARTTNNVLTLDWQHCSIVGVKNDLRIYIDGRPQSLTYERTFTTLSTGDSTRVLNIGRSNHTSTIIPFSGWSDDFRIYEKAISDSEIRLLASRRGIAYELAPRKSYFLPPTASTYKPYLQNYRSQIIGGGLK